MLTLLLFTITVFEDVTSYKTKDQLIILSDKIVREECSTCYLYSVTSSRAESMSLFCTYFVRPCRLVPAPCRMAAVAAPDEINTDNIEFNSFSKLPEILCEVGNVLYSQRKPNQELESPDLTTICSQEQVMHGNLFCNSQTPNKKRMLCCRT